MPRPHLAPHLIAALLAAGLAAHAQSATAKDPTTQLTSEFVYKYLTGEIALQRGEAGIASSMFYELARNNRNAVLAERATRAAAYSKNPSLLFRAARLWAETDPASGEAQQAAAQVLLGSGMPTEARPYLEKLLTEEDGRGNRFLYLDGLLSRHADKTAALRLAQELARPYADLPEARFTLGHLAWNLGQAERAISELDAAEALRPGWESAALLRVEILRQKSGESAATFMHSFLETYPAADEVRLAYARLLVNQNQLAQARQQFTLLVEGTPDSPEIPMAVGLLAGQLQDYTEADRYLHLALERGFRDHDRIHLYLGHSAEQQGNDDQALQWYRRIATGAHQFDAHLRITGILARQQGLEQARLHLHSLTNLGHEEQAMASLFEAGLLSQAKNYQEAYVVLDQAVRTLPNSPEMVYDFAMAAEKIRRFDIMEQQLRKLILIRPDYAQAYNALGYTLADRNERLGEAAVLIEKAHKLSPDNYFILDSMGWLKYRQGNLETALDYLRRAHDLKADPEIAAHLGEVLWQRGQHEEARKTWEDALRYHPDSEPLLDTFKKFQP